MSPLPEGGLRVHLIAHHARDVAAGASGATLALGHALGSLGCAVSYFFYDDAFGSNEHTELSRMIRFPWRVASHLVRGASEFDVVDATTGDAWVWGARGRPGRVNAALVARSHGLEHVAVDELRRRSEAGEVALSHRFGLYHGGYRLWEVRRSLLAADAQVFLNEPDAQYAVTKLGIPAATATVIPNGVPDYLLDLARVAPAAEGGTLALAFIGSWIPRKGIRSVVQAAALLSEQGVDFSLLLLGTGGSEADILSQFAESPRQRVRVVPRYEPHELPGLLNGSEVLLHPSWTEGFSLALVEGMACGLAPVATRAGGATSLVHERVTGVVIDADAGGKIANAVAAMAANRVQLGRMRIAAQEAVKDYRWSAIAERMLGVYRQAMERSVRRA